MPNIIYNIYQTTLYNYSRNKTKAKRKKKGCTIHSQSWWLTSSIPTLVCQRQEDCCEFKARLDCILSSRSVWATENLTRNKNKNI